MKIIIQTRMKDESFSVCNCRIKSIEILLDDHDPVLMARGEVIRHIAGDEEAELGKALTRFMAKLVP